MPEDVLGALSSLRSLLLDGDSLVRAIASGRRRGEPAPPRRELRPVDLKRGSALQIVTHREQGPVTTQVTSAQLPRAVDELLAEAYGNWHVETLTQTVQLRVTRKGLAQVHRAPAPDRDAAPSRKHDREPAHLLDPGDPLFAVLGADADKRRQVDAFVRALAASLPAATRAAQGRPLRVVDLGCGNAYLTFGAHRWLQKELDGAVTTLGVEVRPAQVATANGQAARAGLDGLTFQAAPILEANPGGPVDVVLALHACDTATDDALAMAVRWRAPVVLAAPCCHRDLQRQLREHPPDAGPHAALVAQPILRERFADVLTDTVRAQLLRLAGYRVRVQEFVDSRHTPRNLLLRAEFTGATPTDEQVAEYLELVAAWGVEPVLERALEDRLAPVLAR